MRNKTGRRKAGPTKTGRKKAGPKKAVPRKKASAARGSARAKPAGHGADSGQERPEQKPGQGRRLTAARARVLLNLEQNLARRIVGKEEAVARVSRVIRVRRAQLDFRPERPDGSFLLVGPTGVGKNEFAYAVAEALLGSEDRVISIDLGELEDEEDLAKLGVTPIPGSPNRYLEGLLTSPVRRDPDAVILLRGMEQAHRAFQRFLFQILERGQIEDLLGPVSFARSIIFVTTHLPREESSGEVGFSRAQRPPGERLRERLERTFHSDLLNAFDEIIELPALTAAEVRQIARYKVTKVLDRMQRRQKEIEVADDVFEQLIPEDLCRQQGAGFLNRTLEERLFNPLAQYLLSHRGRQALRVVLEGGQVVIREPPSGNSSGASGRTPSPVRDR